VPRWFQRKEYSVSIKCYKKALTYYNDVPPNHECSSAAEYKELMLLLEERLRVMRQGSILQNSVSAENFPDSFWRNLHPK
jgi:hypothetical protein